MLDGWDSRKLQDVLGFGVLGFGGFGVLGFWVFWGFGVSMRLRFKTCHAHYFLKKPELLRICTGLGFRL